MSRFSNLEFDGDARAQNRVEAVRDEGFFAAEADELLRRGRFDGALRSYSRAVERNPAVHGPWGAQVRMLIELGEFREAKLWADKAAERFPKEPEILAAKARALVRVGDIEAALAFSDASFEERGDAPGVWLARGDVLLLCKDKGAPHCFDRALGGAAGDWLLHWQAARIQAFHRRHARALAYALEASERAPDRAMNWLEVGRAQTTLGMGAKARRTLQQARELDPELPGLDEALKAAEPGLLGGFIERLRDTFS